MVSDPNTPLRLSFSKPLMTSANPLPINPKQPFAFDFSKAFDTVPHERILAKLSHYGIHGNTLNWISSFLQTRTQRVVLDGSYSSFVPVLSGVPQGTVLGPLLFLCFINDITNDIHNTIRLYADDCILYRTIKSPNDCISLQTDIDILFSWTKTWQLSFNPSKCTKLTITRKRTPINYIYILNDHPLPDCDSLTYLGPTFPILLIPPLKPSMLSAETFIGPPVL